jgi:hypothetical protein
MADNKKVHFWEIEIGTYFKIWDTLFVKISYDDYEDDNVFNFERNYVESIGPDEVVEIVENVEITVKTPE